MKKILVVTGSVRPNSVNKKVVPMVVNVATALEAEVTVADLSELNMPLFDAELPPTAEGYTIPHDSVMHWSNMVKSADGIVLVTPEYNHTMTPVQLNAIDWLAAEWVEKPVAMVGYGWRSGASQAQATAREALSNLKAVIIDTETNLYFTRDLTPAGDAIDEKSVNEKIAKTLAKLIEVC
jgi:NAD(P)H-dependent FMN reductase